MYLPVNIEDILSVDMTPLSSISISGMDVASCPDMSVAKSMSVDLGTFMSVEFDDRAREIDATAATPSESATDNPIGACCFRNPSVYLRLSIDGSTVMFCYYSHYNTKRVIR